MRTRLIPVIALAKREILQFIRDRARLIGTLAQVFGIWAILGFGFGDSFSYVDISGASVPYMVYLFPGMILLVILFASIFATISIVEDRQTGFLHAALIAPLSRAMLALGTVSGSAVMAMFQASLLLFAIPLIDIDVPKAGVVLAIVLIVLISFGFTSLGAIFAWRIKTTRGFHAVMNLLLMPLWILSGAMFPAEGAHPVMQTVIKLNPVSYALESLRYAFSQRPGLIFSDGILDLLVTVVMSIALFVAVALAMPRSLRTD